MLLWPGDVSKTLAKKDPLSVKQQSMRTAFLQYYIMTSKLGLSQRQAMGTDGDVTAFSGVPRISQPTGNKMSSLYSNMTERYVDSISEPELKVNEQISSIV